MLSIYRNSVGMSNGNISDKEIYYYNDGTDLVSLVNSWTNIPKDSILVGYLKVGGVVIDLNNNETSFSELNKTENITIVDNLLIKEELPKFSDALKEYFVSLRNRFSK